MWSQISKWVGATVLAVALGASSASALNASYGDFAGTTVDFLNVAESTSGADVLFDAPVGVGDGLFFFPSVFAADSAVQPSVSGTLTLHVRAKAGLFLESITLEAVGDYTITGIASASVSATLDVLDVAPGTNGLFATAAVVTPSTPYTSGADAYSGLATVNLAGLGITEVQLTYVNTLTASSQGGAAFIQNKVLSGPQITAKAGPAVPEPTAAVVFGVGALLIGARVRRPRA